MENVVLNIKTNATFCKTFTPKIEDETKIKRTHLSINSYFNRTFWIVPNSTNNSLGTHDSHLFHSIAWQIYKLSVQCAVRSSYMVQRLRGTSTFSIASQHHQYHSEMCIFKRKWLTSELLDRWPWAYWEQSKGAERQRDRKRASNWKKESQEGCRLWGCVLRSCLWL